ncbi:ketopantoate reductase family protein [Gordonia rhizosphera]|uniref:2-dehydropantoate 2-reductase n=1 Tax=Gordonia rhizosphera NBRC 16068 TaxID=1108045 RepID=K6WJ14_9ACTN|nr:2-dehydropantoate 2-reductase [Gordonia rhizosphera]GAB93771.1 ketopantoate reductase PanE/ApbA family protein [Gordonia rhizosphera NBRC 16068]
MHVVVYGAGAVGGVVGAELFRSGTPTTLIARGAHLQAIRDNGLVLDAADGRHTLPIPAAASAAEIDWTDDTVVLLCVKSQQTTTALDDLRAHAPRTTPIVSAQNGVVNEREILRRFPNTYAMCVMIMALHLAPGVVIQGSSAVPGILDVGRFPTGVDEVTDAIAATLRSAGFLAEPRDDIMAWKYRKLVLNVVNGIDACYRPDGQAFGELIHRARREAEAAITAAGIEMVGKEVDRERRDHHMVRRDTGEHSLGSSTWQSLQRGLDDVEIDYLAGEIVLLGRLHGIPTPVNELVQTETARLVREHLPAGSLDAADALRVLDRGRPA